MGKPFRDAERTISASFLSVRGFSSSANAGAIQLRMNIIDPNLSLGSARMRGASAKSAAVRMNSRRVSMRKVNRTS